MQHFEFRVYDGRRVSPSVMSVVTRDAESARALAERMRKQTNEDGHIDVWQSARYLFTVGQAASIGDGAYAKCGST